MPPPLPPLNLSPTLTNEELAEMEGDERHNVEARIHCLRNISVLLNASMIQMQQYMNICSATRWLLACILTSFEHCCIEEKIGIKFSTLLITLLNKWEREDIFKLSNLLWKLDNWVLLKSKRGHVGKSKSLLLIKIKQKNIFFSIKNS